VTEAVAREITSDRSLSVGAGLLQVLSVWAAMELLLIRKEGANCGGILRNSVGNFIVAFSAYIGSCSVLHSEIWGITHGLQIAKTRWIMCVRVELDSAKHNFLNQLRTYTNYLINSLSILTSSLHIDKSKTS
jgi:hypothetical protein